MTPTAMLRCLMDETEIASCAKAHATMALLIVISDGGRKTEGRSK